MGEVTMGATVTQAARAAAATEPAVSEVSTLAVSVPSVATTVHARPQHHRTVHRTARRLACAALAALLAGALGVGGARPATASDIDDFNAKLRTFSTDLDKQKAAAEANARAKAAERRKLDKKLADASARLKQATLDLNTVEARLPLAEAELAQAVADVEAAQREAAVLAERLTDAQAEETRITDQAETQEVHVAAARQQIVRMAREAVRGSGGPSTLGVVTGAQDASEFVRATAVQSSATRSQSRALAAMQDAQATLRNQAVRLEAIRETIAQLKKAADDNVVATQAAQRRAQERKAEVDRLIAQKTQLKADIEEERELTLDELKKTQEDEARFAGQVKQLAAQQAERDRIIAQKRAAEEAAKKKSGTSSGGGSNPAPAPPASHGRFLTWPVSNPHVTSSYGMRFHPVLGYTRLHAGTDFRAPCGTPIYAAQSGIVVLAQYQYSAGNNIMIDHGSYQGRNVMTRYMHFTRYVVGRGAYVSRGQLVGYSGATGGVSTACHLHFEVYVNGSTQNPMGWLG
ncbi:MAG: peptidoglycan DD-metalloendopeptidase family protein [Cellulomonadaceae bacterium]|jgi:murein DD-endopeptidase MepM/ murein hydrolase activator NlpD|nr:peptidoglycan DD-metalloendopeptidase family protein [Cellulomonadaceae bacterium]